MKDINSPAYLEIIIRSDGKVVWINADGICEFRACKIGELIVKDERIDKKIEETD